MLLRIRHGGGGDGRGDAVLLCIHLARRVAVSSDTREDLLVDDAVDDGMLHLEVGSTRVVESSEPRGESRPIVAARFDEGGGANVPLNSDSSALTKMRARSTSCALCS